MKKEYDAIVLATGKVEENSELFGLKATAKGITADRNTYETSEEKILIREEFIKESAKLNSFRLKVTSIDELENKIKSDSDSYEKLKISNETVVNTLSKYKSDLVVLQKEKDS